MFQVLAFELGIHLVVTSGTALHMKRGIVAGFKIRIVFTKRRKEVFEVAAVHAHMVVAQRKNGVLVVLEHRDFDLHVVVVRNNAQKPLVRNLVRVLDFS